MLVPHGGLIRRKGVLASEVSFTKLHSSHLGSSQGTRAGFRSVDFGTGVGTGGVQGCKYGRQLVVKCYACCKVSRP